MPFSRSAGDADGKPGEQGLPDEFASQPKNSGRRFHGAVANLLGRAIVSGRVPVGERLTGEIANAEALDISRSAYREAVQVLAAKGLVVSKPKDGTRVLPRSRWNMLDPMVLAWAFAEEPDAAFVRDLFELRAVVEPAVARMAAERRTEAQLAEMRECIGLMGRKTLHVPEGRKADRRFHALLIEASGNQAMIPLTASIAAAVDVTTLLKSRLGSGTRDPMPDHIAVFDAVELRDGDGAAKAMERLITLAHEDTHAAIAKS
ncbi:FadR/GntR family transcriptional regulator [Erythrobacter sp. EC-HK427]|uniref:FadR/GntR family transcriptional regulator n=1 Tax=Erythrobacter sp. EC-HK427 TaxID=2038396 RepID=UPI0012558667|nr:FadR/GntR family transcriptional regulator [Erythrobacter sp. EC-HK427]VVT01328.1 GntR family transcriptional regulator [Erythrobacter sp. EC-HK427]